jgi:hypothetical protein
MNREERPGFCLLIAEASKDQEKCCQDHKFGCKFDLCGTGLGEEA